MVKKYRFRKGQGAIPHIRKEQVVSNKWQDDKRLTLTTQENGLGQCMPGQFLNKKNRWRGHFLKKTIFSNCLKL